MLSPTITSVVHSLSMLSCLLICATHYNVNACKAYGKNWIKKFELAKIIPELFLISTTVARLDRMLHYIFN